jgi:mRNA-degrading endonuclease YafQ of YafQ-DinJ toxin-antitoxin module
MWIHAKGVATLFVDSPLQTPAQDSKLQLQGNVQTLKDFHHDLGKKLLEHALLSSWRRHRRGEIKPDRLS